LTPSGNYVVMRVVGHHVDKGGTAPELELLHFYGPTSPTLALARTLDARPLAEKHDFGYGLTRRFMAPARSQRQMPLERLQRLGMGAGEETPGKQLGCRVLSWRPGLNVSIDRFIE